MCPGENHITLSPVKLGTAMGHSSSREDISKSLQ